ncbi:MAG TPA: hypothetical protein VER96_30590 [Polyangiaceae bacterium]|nr:hypothetical protein [Polyangiaceae bacterium]
MPATKIMVVRHAEKPAVYNGSSYTGVNATGASDPESLVTLGWERAGALAALFAPARGSLQSPLLATPASLFASDPSKSSDPDDAGDSGPSQRPYQTISALAAKLGITIDTTFKKKKFAHMVTAALAAPGTVLVSWQHEDIPSLGTEILKQTGTTQLTLPSKWPGARYDLVWVFDRPTGSGPIVAFNQVPQLLLAGDLDSILPVPPLG